MGSNIFNKLLFVCIMNKNQHKESKTISKWPKQMNSEEEKQLKLTRRRLKRAKAISVEHNRSHNSNGQQQQHNVSHCHHFFFQKEERESDKTLWTEIKKTRKQEPRRKLSERKRKPTFPFFRVCWKLPLSVKKGISYIEWRQKHVFERLRFFFELFLRMVSM